MQIWKIFFLDIFFFCIRFMNTYSCRHIYWTSIFQSIGNWRSCPISNVTTSCEKCIITSLYMYIFDDYSFNPHHFSSQIILKEISTLKISVINCFNLNNSFAYKCKRIDIFVFYFVIILYILLISSFSVIVND